LDPIGCGCASGNTENESRWKHRRIVTDYLPMLLTGAGRKHWRAPSRPKYAVKADPYDAWAVEAGGSLTDAGGGGQLVALSYERLREYRVRLMSEVRHIVETQRVRGPRQLSAKLKELKIRAAEGEVSRIPCWPSSPCHPAERNGTLLVNNTFVEWSTVQAVRRARPSVRIISFRHTEQDQAIQQPAHLHRPGRREPHADARWTHSERTSTWRFSINTSAGV